MLQILSGFLSCITTLICFGYLPIMFFVILGRDYYEVSQKMIEEMKKKNKKSGLWKGNWFK